MMKENIRIEGYIGTWYAIDTLEHEGTTYHLLESEYFGDNASNLIVDDKGILVIDCVCNGFEDLFDFLELEEMEVGGNLNE